MAGRRFNVTIPSPCSRVEPVPHAEESCKERNLVERAVARLKWLRWMRPRHNKLSAMFPAMVHVSCIANAIT
jgi:transposase